MNRNLRFALIGAIVLLLAAGLALWRGHHAQPADDARVAPPGARAPVAADPGRTPDDLRHIADDLNRPTGAPRGDVELLAHLVSLYRSAVHGGNPVGDNAEITAVLTGQNRLGWEFIPRSHPAINSAGELCDRWGTPYFFHQISGTVMEIRSAGPDRRMYSADDLLAGP